MGRNAVQTPFSEDSFSFLTLPTAPPFTYSHFLPVVFRKDDREKKEESLSGGTAILEKGPGGDKTVSETAKRTRTT